MISIIVRFIVIYKEGLKLEHHLLSFKLLLNHAKNLYTSDDF